MATKYIDMLDEDPIISGQMYYCVSFLSPEGIKNCSTRGLKIRGVYATKKLADQRAKEIQEFDSDFHTFVGEIGKWCPWDPDPNSIEDHVYKEKELNDLMHAYRENLKKTRLMEAKIKKDKLERAEKEGCKPRSKVELQRMRMREKLEKSKEKEPRIEEVDVEKKAGKLEISKPDVAKDADQIEKDGKELLDNQKEIEEKEKKIQSVDEKLKKIEDLYNKLNKK